MCIDADRALKAQMPRIGREPLEELDQRCLVVLRRLPQPQRRAVPKDDVFAHLSGHHPVSLAPSVNGCSRAIRGSRADNYRESARPASIRRRPRGATILTRESSASFPAGRPRRMRRDCVAAIEAWAEVGRLFAPDLSRSRG